MNRILYLLTVGLFVCILPHAAGQEPAICNSPMIYENHNQVDPKALRLDTITGVANDEQGISIPNVCIGLFLEKNHTLVTSTKSGEDGRFSLANVPPGQYRLVAKHPALCAANVPLLVGSGTHRSTKELLLHMKVGGTDSCSYGDVARKKAGRAS